MPGQPSPGESAPLLCFNCPELPACESKFSFCCRRRDSTLEQHCRSLCFSQSLSAQTRVQNNEGPLNGSGNRSSIGEVGQLPGQRQSENVLSNRTVTACRLWLCTFVLVAQKSSLDFLCVEEEGVQNRCGTSSVSATNLDGVSLRSADLDGFVGWKKSELFQFDGVVVRERTLATSFRRPFVDQDVLPSPL